MKLRNVRPIAVSAILFSVLAGSSLRSLPQRRFLMGFTSWSSGTTPEAAKATYEFISRSADVITEHIEGVPWTEALSGEPFRKGFQENIERRKKNQPKELQLVLAISPLNMGRSAPADYYGDRENMPLPEPFRGKHLNDPVIQMAYLNYCRRMAEYFVPDYWIIGIESNELLNNTPGEWENYLELSRFIYAELKKDFPKIPIAHSVTLHKLLDKKNSHLDQYQHKIKDFISSYDFNAISFYPFFLGMHSSDEFRRAFEAIRQFGDKPIAISESGHPAEPIIAKTWNLNIPATPEEQNDFVNAMLTTAQKDGYLFVTMFASKDFDEMWRSFPEAVKDLGRLWRDTGIVDENNVKRTAYDSWMEVLARTPNADLK
jgi:hypothetical protein